MSAKIYAKFKNLDIVQWVTGNVYSYQSLSKNLKKFCESTTIVKITTSDIMNILEKVLKYHTNMDTKAPIDGRSSGADAAFQRGQSKI